MKEKYFRFCDIDFLIKPVFDEFFSFAKDYEISLPNDPVVISNTIEEITTWKISHGNENYPLWYFETLFIHSKIADQIAKANGCIFHGSTVEIDDGGFIFTAPSGTGKSTHVRILRKVFGKEKVKYINDDKPFVRLIDNKYFVFGSPWDGKERLSSNVSKELKGIFIINRSTTNSIQKLDSGMAVMHLIKQIHVPIGEENTKVVTNILFDIVNKIPIYLLNVNMDDSAAITSMNVIKKINKGGE